MGKSNYYWILDAGHGGVDGNGVYHTDPKINKKFTFEDGFTIYEGQTNRQICKLLQGKLLTAGIDFALVYHDVDDWGLVKRTNLANSVYIKNPNAILLSIHSNAGKGRGIEVFTAPGQNKSDIVANYFIKSYHEYMGEFLFRSDRQDGDEDKEEKFMMVYRNEVNKTGPLCPALLVENLFFDTRYEADYLVNPQGQERIADTMFAAILEMEKQKPI